MCGFAGYKLFGLPKDFHPEGTSWPGWQRNLGISDDQKTVVARRLSILDLSEAGNQPMH